MPKIPKNNNFCNIYKIKDKTIVDNENFIYNNTAYNDSASNTSNIKYKCCDESATNIKNTDNLNEIKCLNNKIDSLKKDNKALCNTILKLNNSFNKNIEIFDQIKNKYELKIKLLKNDLSLAMNKINKIYNLTVLQSELTSNYKKEKSLIESKCVYNNIINR